MLDHHGFNLWADSYDASVKQSEKDNEYPFAGYTDVMNTVYSRVMRSRPAKVLDVGFGTAILTKPLYDAGISITGIDFSAEMLAVAQRKMPKAKLLQWDFTRGIPPVLEEELFDCIISTYALHHLETAEQFIFIAALLKRLKPQGVMLIGDVCFETGEALAQCREASGDLWDDEENYLVFSGLKEALRGHMLLFHRASFCAGVIEIHG